jgi:tetratricopeptide (TPR) repeat protein
MMSFSSRRVLAIVALSAVACARRSTPSSGSASGADAAALHAPLANGIVFVHDDYPAALAAARREKRPLFVDVWAAWCHTCMSMKEYVLPDPKLARLAGKFVWAMIDLERPENAPFLAKFSTTVLPTLWVVDPATEAPALKWIGSATVAELEGLLDAAAAATSGDPSSNAAETAFALGNRAAGEGRAEDAIDAYRRALALGLPGWERRPQVIEALSMRLNETDRAAEAVDLAVAEVPSLPPGTSLANVLQNALEAVDRLPPEAPARAKLGWLVAESRRVAEDPAQPLLADDRSSLYEHVVDALRTSDPVASKGVARAWATFLEGEADKAKTPRGRAVFDAHRLGAYLELGEVEKALPMLERSERDLPDDYNPPARLARAQFERHHYDAALLAVRRALGKAYGPRKLQIRMLEADILRALGRKADQRRALETAIAEADAQKLPARYGRVRAQLVRRLSGIE